MNLIRIFLLHGLGEHSWSLIPLQFYLQCHGYTTHIIDYPVDSLEFEESLEYIDKEMLKLANKSTEVIIIGQSMGGVMAHSLHTKGWTIKLSVSIGSPLHGARILNQLNEILPATLKKLFYKKPHYYLMQKEAMPEPPHPYHTITLGLAFFSFDSCVYTDEAMFKPEKNTHLPWASHSGIFFNPRLGLVITDILEAC